MEKSQPETNETFVRSRLLATGGLIGGLLASTCCIAPLVLVFLGVGGAWVGNLTALAPYQWYFVTFALVCLVAGFWLTCFRPKAHCVEGSHCANPKARGMIKGVLWLGLALVGSAILANIMAPLLY